MEKIVYKDESYKISGAIFEVYKELGPGFLKAVYQECLCKEFSSLGMPYAAQPELTI